MRVVVHGNGRYVAICDEELSPRLELTRHDLVMLRIDGRILCERICQSLTIAYNHEYSRQISGISGIGSWSPERGSRCPVLMAVPLSKAHLVELLATTVAGEKRPTVLLTPTRNCWSSRADAIAEEARHVLVPLDEVLERRRGAWKATASWDEYVNVLDRVAENGASPDVIPKRDRIRDRVHRLKEMERDIIDALAEKRIFGIEAKNAPSQEKLARWAGYAFDASLKASLSSLVKAEFLDNGRHHGRRGGYFLTQDGQLAAEILSKS